MSKERKFIPNGCQHLYQISIDKSLIFCTVADMLLLFSLICVKSKQYFIHITHVCIMYNHFHIQAYVQTKEDMEHFIGAVTWAYAVMYNKKYGLLGHLFKHSYGNAPKVKPKKIVENLIYIANNPVVKKASSCAWNYRWNFLRYYQKTGHPFSEEYNPLDATKDMLYLVKTVRSKALEGKVVDYNFFDSERFINLSEIERQQLIDIIINSYNVIDYQPVIQKYSSMENYCRVLDEIEGNEYDVDDDREQEDYRHYNKMIAIAFEEGYDLRKHRFAGVEGHTISHKLNDENMNNLMPIGLAKRLIKRFRIEAEATQLEISKFLRI